MQVLTQKRPTISLRPHCNVDECKHAANMFAKAKCGSTWCGAKGVRRKTTLNICITCIEVNSHMSRPHRVKRYYSINAKCRWQNVGIKVLVLNTTCGCIKPSHEMDVYRLCVVILLSHICRKQHRNIVVKMYNDTLNIVNVHSMRLSLSHTHSNIFTIY